MEEGAPPRLCSFCQCNKQTSYRCSFGALLHPQRGLKGGSRVGPPRGYFGRNRRNTLENIESKSFGRSLDRFESIWIDSETLIFRRFEPGSLSTFFRKSDLEKPEYWTRKAEIGI